jgi:hypothetical protein
MRSVSFHHPADQTSASYRYRAEMPAKHLGAPVNIGGTEIIVISKPWALEQAKIAKKAGITVVVDFCDDHFQHPSFGQMYRDYAKLADYCVCPTEEMRTRIPHKNVAVIPDPYEMEELEPHATGDSLLWFGHNAGLKALKYKLPNLTVVTGPNVGEGMIPYSPERLKEEMAKANIAIFPTVKGHEYKSPNRLINALRMGLFPVCDPHPSYTEFKKFIWSTEVPTGVKWCREFRGELNDFVREGQDHIRGKYSPEAIGNQWRDLLEAL